ncbi:GNAT family N-acetyltransferase [Clostridium gasigenes]|uniref:GNAT family N-acetyltransferase n=1 Tax=Clostridium gasigenes TaxID=94869 RepID=UPI001C0BAE7B|nr:GNAT family N-acetyltransferase [Clostridium gasigenes]MBU3133746.1 GNAT family N-acetyltransferase [Clostridium gasigenes]
MIRNINSDDIYKVIELLKTEIGDFNEKELIEKLKCDTSSILVYECDNKIVGVSATIANNKVEKGEVTIYVSEAYRRRGIGGKLFSKAIDYLEGKHINNIETEIRTEKIYSGDFFINRGFRKWFGYHKMMYCGEKVESDLQLINYDNKYYDCYKNVYEDCFFELRSALGFKPTRACYSADELIKNKDNIFLFLDGKDLIGSVSLINNEIDDLIVNEKYQGNGYGKKLLNFAINYYQNNDVENINLGVAQWNDKAIKLYTSVGFKVVVSSEVYCSISEK